MEFTVGVSVVMTTSFMLKYPEVFKAGVSGGCNRLEHVRNYVHRTLHGHIKKNPEGYKS